MGGETEEMPGLYQDEDYDLAGFCVGVVEESEVITGKNVVEGDVLIGLASSGAHSNGYSLIRKVIEVSGVDIHNEQLGDKPLKDALMAPTKIYVKAIQSLQKNLGNNNLHAMAHITGGGLTENLPRVLPDDLTAEINTQSWQMPAVFQWLQQQGNIDTQEMYRTFNCGVGYVIVVAKENAEKALELLQQVGESAWILGNIVHRQTNAVTYQ